MDAELSSKPPFPILVALGTRPEAIKLAPVIAALRGRPELFRTVVCATAQHREMLDQTLEVFDIRPDIDLDLMAPDQTLSSLTARILEGMAPVFAGADPALEGRPPALAVVQGDTTTVLATALCAYHHGVPVAHVEAGLRTGDKRRPFPEEINRRLTDQIADWHFAPTECARRNLLAEGIAPERVVVTGNTAIDALLHARERVAEMTAEGRPPVWPGVDESALEGRRVVAVTGHRRESFGPGLRAICGAVRALAERFADVAFVYPVHLNPRVRGPVHEALEGPANVHLTDPLDYLAFVALLERSTLILTDSGGIQEEAPTLGKPVLVLRDTTERPEAVEAGAARLVGADESRIIEEAARLLTDSEAYAAMSQATNPFGDGRAGERIVGLLAEGMVGAR